MVAGIFFGNYTFVFNSNKGDIKQKFKNKENR